MPPRASRSHGPRLRGEESQKIWRRSHGTSFLLCPDLPAITDATDNLKSPCQNNEVGKAFFINTMFFHALPDPANLSLL